MDPKATTAALLEQSGPVLLAKRAVFPFQSSPQEAAPHPLAFANREILEGWRTA